MHCPGRSAKSEFARLNANVGELNRTLLVVESKALLEGQKRGIAVSLMKGQRELRKLEHPVCASSRSRATVDGAVLVRCARSGRGTAGSVRCPDCYALTPSTRLASLLKRVFATDVLVGDTSN